MLHPYFQGTEPPGNPDRFRESISYPSNSSKSSIHQIAPIDLCHRPEILYDGDALPRAEVNFAGANLHHQRHNLRSIETAQYRRDCRSDGVLRRSASYRRGVSQLIREISYDDLLRAFKDGFLEVTYVQSMVAILTENTGSQNELYRPVSISSPIFDLTDVLDEAFEKTGLSPRQAETRQRAIGRYFDKSDDAPMFVKPPFERLRIQPR